MRRATPAPENPSRAPPPFVSFADQAMYLAHVAGGQHAVMQLLWRYRRPVDIDALTRFRDNLAHGRLARLIRPALLAFGRHQWASAPVPSSVLEIAAAPLAPEALQAWVDAQVELPLDPARGPAWTLTIQPLTDGSTIVSFVVSHCIADGMAAALAVSEAARGERRPPSYPPGSAQRPAGKLGAELLRAMQDAPTTLRAIAQLARTARISRAVHDTPAASPAATAADDRTVAFPSAFVRVPASVWDAKARSLGANRFALLTAVTAAFAQSLGRARGDEATLLIPVNQRDGLLDTGGNRVSLATLKVPLEEVHGRLRTFQQRLQATLLRTRREPDPLAALLPLAPFVPRRAFSAASHVALAALASRPVTCSYVGDWPLDVLLIDGAPADRFCFRGVDRQASVRLIEGRQGVASIMGCAIPGFVLINFVAYQPGVVTESGQLRALVEGLLAGFDIAGDFFDD